MKLEQANDNKDNNNVDIEDPQNCFDSKLEEESFVEEWKAERAVGISEFLNNDSQGFQGIIKHRYRDFIVQEIDLQGQVATLTDCLYDEKLVRTESNQPVKAATSIFDETTLKQALNLTSWSNNDYQAIISLAKGKDADVTKEIITKPFTCKEERTRFHQTIRSLFQGYLQTETINDSIKVYRRGEAPSTNQHQRDHRNYRPADQHKYLQFTLWKENMDTIDAIQLIARRLHMSAKDFTYSGTKDKRGVTMQHIVVRNITLNKILGVNKLGEERRLKICNVKAVGKPLSLGELQGNRFNIIIRNVCGASPTELGSIVERFSQIGFINYFGLQRFGTTSVSSHQIGLALLRGDFANAINLILDPREDEANEAAIEARRYWKETGDATAAKEMFPPRYTAERQLLAFMSRTSSSTPNNDYQGALLNINRELRLLYVHSVQSLIWNRMTSHRVSLYGRQLVPGDLVFSQADSIVDKKPIMITAENINQYQVEDLILPLPGYATEWPANELATAYENELKTLALTREAFKPRNNALWDLPGNYRHVFIKPRDLTYRISHYNDADTDLPETFSDDDTKSFLGLQLVLTLPPSSYATMAIRELMHSGTDPRYHQKATKRHKLQTSGEK